MDQTDNLTHDEEIEMLEQVAASRYVRDDGRVFYEAPLPHYNFSIGLSKRQGWKAVQMMDQEEVTLLSDTEWRFEHHPNYWEFLDANGEWAYAHRCSFENLPADIT